MGHNDNDNAYQEEINLTSEILRTSSAERVSKSLHLPHTATTEENRTALVQER